MNPIYLLQQGAATGGSVLVERPGVYVWKVLGTFGSGQISLQKLNSDGVTWQGDAALVMFAEGELPVLIKEDTYIRAATSGATSPSFTSSLSLIL